MYSLLGQGSRPLVLLSKTWAGYLALKVQQGRLIPQREVLQRMLLLHSFDI